MLTSAANELIRIMLAPVCAACAALLDQPLSGPVCRGCWCAVQPMTADCCDRCGDALAASGPADRCCPRCRRQPPVLHGARSAGLYEGSLRQIIHAFKYQGRRVLAAPLGAMVRIAGVDFLREADGVVPVPLHPWRAFRRGFNQADDLARHLGLPVVAALRRRSSGPPQASLPAAQRHANVKHAFVLRRSPSMAGAAGRSRVEGRALILIDDVMTTGATLDACARLLLEAGARSVRALTVARAVAGPPAPHPQTHRL